MAVPEIRTVTSSVAPSSGRRFLSAFRSLYDRPITAFGTTVFLLFVFLAVAAADFAGSESMHHCRLCVAGLCYCQISFDDFTFEFTQIFYDT